MRNYTSTITVNIWQYRTTKINLAWTSDASTMLSVYIPFYVPVSNDALDNRENNISQFCISNNVTYQVGNKRHWHIDRNRRQGLVSSWDVGGKDGRGERDTNRYVSQNGNRIESSSYPTHHQQTVQLKYPLIVHMLVLIPMTHIVDQRTSIHPSMLRRRLGELVPGVWP